MIQSKNVIRKIFNYNNTILEISICVYHYIIKHISYNNF